MLISQTTIEVLFYFGIFVAGLFIGSFLNVVADRIVKGKSILFGRSACEFCKQTLSAFDLLPLVSYISTLGKCRYCKKSLSIYYPLSEIITGGLFALIAYYMDFFNNSSNVFAWLIFVYFLIVFSFYIIMFLTDVKYGLIPNKIVYPAIIFVLLFTIFNMAYTAIATYRFMTTDSFGQYLFEAGYWHSQMTSMLQSFGLTLVSTLGIGLFFWLLTRIKQGRAMGGGDVKLAILIGLFNGFYMNILAIFLGFLLGAVVSLVLIVVRRKKMKDTVPFGPFLILGSLIALFWGDRLVDWYLGIF
jgi:leader peptidase (prepilin peptidase) / N-methyltransferase